MANITVSANTTVVNVDSTTNNVSVSSTLSNIVVGEARFVANSTIREALSVTDTGGDGSLSYSNVSGVFTYTGPSAAESRAHISLTDTGGDGSASYNNSTGVITYTGPSAAEVRAHLSATLPITYNSTTGDIGFDANLDDLTLKKYQETVFADGTLSGNISVNITNGTVHQVDLGGDITGITLTNISTGGSATIFFTQDAIGGAILDTTTHASNWTDWKFTNGFTDFSTGANKWNALNVFYDGTNHYATLITETGATVQNSDLANSNITVNGTTIELGSSGVITDFTSNVLIDANANITQSLTVGEDITVSNALTVTGLTTSGSLSAGDTTFSKITFSTSSPIIDGITNGSSSSNININTNQITVGDPLYTAGVLREANIVSPGPMSLRGGEAIFLNNETEFLKIQSNIPDGVTPYIRSYAGFTGSGNANVYIDPLGSQTTDGGFRVMNNANTSVFSVNHLGTTSIAGATTITGNLTVNSDSVINGNLQVQGNIDYVNSEDLLVKDQSISLNVGNVVQDAMIIVDRQGIGGGSNVELKWNESTDNWQFTNDGSTYNNMLTSALSRALISTTTASASGGGSLAYDNSTGVFTFAPAVPGIALNALSVATTAASGDGALVYDSGTGVFTFTPADAGQSDYGNVQVADFLTNGFGSNTIITTGDITASDFLGDSITATSGFAINSGNGTTVTSKFGINNTVTETANIAGKGFGVFNFGDSSNTAVAYSGTDVFEWYIMTGSTTAGSTTLTITSMIRGIDGTAASVSDLNVGQVISNGQNVSFPTDAYVVSVNSGAGTVEMSKAASFTNTFGTFTAGAFVSGVQYEIITLGTTDWYTAAGTVVTAGAFNTGTEYKIIATGDTDFTLIGAADSNPDTVFTATGPGTGTGTAGPTSITYSVGTTFTAAAAGTGDGTAAETTQTILDAGMVDTTTGLVVTLQSALRVNGGGSDSALAGTNFRNTPFGYPASGPVGTDFDIFTAGTGSNYTTTLTPFMMGSTPVTNNKTALNAPLGITIGENTQLTNRGENDIFKSFGMNMMWDGLDSDLTQPIQPQVLFKSYTDNSQQKPAVGSVGIAGGAPRLFFSTANGNANADGFDAYPRANQELGRLSFWGSTGEQLNPSSYNVPGFISVAAADNWDTWSGGTAGNTNVYMGATSNGSNPDTYLSYKSGELFLGGGNSKPVTLAPAYNGSASNPSEAYNLLPTKWAEANYASGTSGAKFSVTNGGSVGGGNVGDMELSLKRVDNSSTLASPVRSLLSGSISGALESGKILFTFTDDGSFGSKLNGFSATVSAPSTIDASVYNGGPFYGSGNETALGNNVYDLSFAFSSGGVAYYYILSGGSRVGYTDIGGSDPFYFISQTLGMTVTTVVSSGVTAKEWKFNLAEQSNNLLLQSDGTTVMHFTDARVFVDEVFRLQNLTTTEINALASPQSGDTVYNTTLNQICFYNGTAWQKITSATM